MNQTLSTLRSKSGHTLHDSRSLTQYSSSFDSPELLFDYLRRCIVFFPLLKLLEKMYTMYK